jgi:hypothetical protein
MFLWMWMQLFDDFDVRVKLPKPEVVAFFCRK